MNCEKCGGECWDNRQKKTEGKMNPKAPDFKCKDESCGWVKWPPRTQSQSKPAGRFNDPETRKEIIRQNSLTNAVNYCTAKATLDKEYKLSGKEVIQVATYFAKYSLGEITVVSNAENAPQPTTAPKEAISIGEDEVKLDEIPF